VRERIAGAKELHHTAKPRQGRKILAHSASCGYGRVRRISPVGAAERRLFRLYGGCAVGHVGCLVTALLTIGGAGTFEGPSAGMSAGAAGGIARATKGCHNPVAAGGPGFGMEEQP
jgi:hypothetical protein